MDIKKDLGNVGELFPQSVFIVGSYDEDGAPNAMNVAWGEERSRHEACINIGDHKTTANIVAKGTFTVVPVLARCARSYTTPPAAYTVLSAR